MWVPIYLLNGKYEGQQVLVVFETEPTEKLFNMDYNEPYHTNYQFDAMTLKHQCHLFKINNVFTLVVKFIMAHILSK